MINGVSKIVGGISSWCKLMLIWLNIELIGLVNFKTSTGDEFIKHLCRTFGRKTELKIKF